MQVCVSVHLKVLQHHLVQRLDKVLILRTCHVLEPPTADHHLLTNERRASDESGHMTDTSLSSTVTHIILLIRLVLFVRVCQIVCVLLFLLMFLFLVLRGLLHMRNTQLVSTETTNYTQQRQQHRKHKNNNNTTTTVECGCELYVYVHVCMFGSLFTVPAFQKQSF